MDLDENPPDAFWDWSPALTPATPVRVVSAAGGLVVAAGDALHMLRPGSQRFRSRDLGADLGVIAVAAEPWSPFRLAIASPMHLGVYSGHQPHDPEVDVTLPGSAYDATHLAWVRHDGETLLYYRQRSGDVSRLRFEGATESITVPKTQAVAADEAGNLALITLVPSDDAAVWSLPAGGKEWDIRGMVSVPVGEDDDETAAFEVHLAAHGTAVAFSMDDCGAEVSWKEHEDETKHFVSPPAVFQGPIAFQSDQAIFAAYNVDGQARILRYVRSGGVTRIARFGVGEDWQGVPATVTGLAWDAERRVLWAASPELGLLKLTEPRAPAKPRALPS